MMSDYYLNLTKADKQRYDEKLRLLGLPSAEKYDPFLTCDEWIDDITKWPDLEFGQIYVYLIDSPGPYTRETLKAYRSLDAYNQYYCGWVHTCYMRLFKDVTLIKAKVRRSQAVTDKPHEAWVAINNADSSVTCGHCSCMAGLGGVCSHVAAILFKVEACHRLGFNKVSCTSTPCQWNQNFTKKVVAAPVIDISFQKPKKDSSITQQSQQLNEKSKFKDNTDLLARLKVANPNAVIFSITEPKLCEIPRVPSLPPAIHDLYKQEYEYLNPEELKQECLKTFENIKLSEDQAEKLENLTRHQSKSLAWFDQRKGRLTASNFHEIMHTNTVELKNKSLLKKVMQYSSNVKDVATEWGIKNEQTALRQYVDTTKKEHVNFTYRNSGLVVHKDYPYLGATPDAIISCDCCGTGVVEVKCPYSQREKIPCAVDSKTFYVKKHQCALPRCPPSLNANHKYYAQIQGQIGLCGAKFCDFVCWTPNGLHIERVVLDSVFFQEMTVKLNNYFINITLPEILSHRLLNEIESVSKTFCVCGNDDSYDNMIGCDNEKCLTEWYHMKCVGLKSTPSGKWFCLKCRNSTKRKAKK